MNGFKQPRERSHWEFFAPMRNGEYGEFFYSRFSINSTIFNDAIVATASPYFAMLPESEFEQLVQQAIITDVDNKPYDAGHVIPLHHFYHRKGIVDIIVPGVPADLSFERVTIVAGTRKELGIEFIQYFSEVIIQIAELGFGIYGIINSKENFE